MVKDWWCEGASDKVAGTMKKRFCSEVVAHAEWLFLRIIKHLTLVPLGVKPGPCRHEGCIFSCCGSAECPDFAARDFSVGAQEWQHRASGKILCAVVHRRPRHCTVVAAGCYNVNLLSFSVETVSPGVQPPPIASMKPRGRCFNSLMTPSIFINHEHCHSRSGTW